jgi:hypothetical protein
VEATRERNFRPEVLNRIDDIIVFHQLTETQVVALVGVMIARVEAALRNKDMAIELTPNTSTLSSQPAKEVDGRRGLALNHRHQMRLPWQPDAGSAMWAARCGQRAPACTVPNSDTSSDNRVVILHARRPAVS